MTCSKCGANTPDNETLCPECGAEQSTKEKKAASTPARKLSRKSLLMIGIAAAVLILAVVSAVALFQKPTGTTPGVEKEALDAQTPPSTAPNGEETEDIAMVIDGKNYTIADVSYYYFNAYQYEMNNGYGYYFIDTTQPLSSQAYIFDTSITWAQYFQNQATSNLQLVHAVVKDANANGVTLNEEYRSLMEEQIVYLQHQATVNSMSYPDYLAARFGSYMTPEAYARNLEENLLASQYVNDYYYSLTFTDEEIEAYYQQNKDSIDGGQRDRSRNYNVRHILITAESLPEGTTADDNAIAQAAQSVLDLWKSGDMTEESFAALATQYTRDPGSVASGGLYENVMKGQMVAEFNDWCYVEGRKAGDVGIVQTSYGYHIMYFVGYSGEEYWYSVCRTALANEAYTQWQTALLAGLTYELTDNMELVG